MSNVLTSGILSNKEALVFDKAHIWHPYSSTLSPITPHMVESANGIELTLADGNTLLDGMSSWWSTIHGYNHPRLNAAAEKQLAKMSHVMFGGLTHAPAISLCERLIAMLPDPLDTVFLADSGSIAVEVSMKMAIQYWHAKGAPDKHRFISLRNGYHGDTLGAMSLCDPVTGMHQLFNGVVSTQFHAEQPACRFSHAGDTQSVNFDSMRKLVEQHHNQVAAIVVEPIVQGAGGMYFYSADYLKKLRELCNEYNLLLIADEIATGFGRTGKMFACEHAHITPDIVCVGKALTGGYLSLAATLTSKQIADTISGGEGGAFMHGPTFMANPLACAIANESLTLLEENNALTDVSRIEQKMTALLNTHKKRLKLDDKIKDVRVLGGIAVVETHNNVDMTKNQRLCLDTGVWLRPFMNRVYVMPAYITSDQQLATIADAMMETVENCC